MSQTYAFPLEELRHANRTSDTGQPLCPRCKRGYLHPYRVHIGLSRVPAGWHGAQNLVGWVAVCVGNRHQNERTVQLYREAEMPLPEDADLTEYPACGFTMPMTPYRSGEYE